MELRILEDAYADTWSLYFVSDAAWGDETYLIRGGYQSRERAENAQYYLETRFAEMLRDLLGDYN